MPRGSETCASGLLKGDCLRFFQAGTLAEVVCFARPCRLSAQMKGAMPSHTTLLSRCRSAQPSSSLFARVEAVCSGLEDKTEIDIQSTEGGKRKKKTDRKEKAQRT